MHSNLTKVTTWIQPRSSGPKDLAFLNPECLQPRRQDSARVKRPGGCLVSINGQTNTPELRNNSIQSLFPESRGHHHHDVVKVGEHLASRISGSKLLLNELE